MRMVPNKPGIYKIVNTVTGLVYVGSAASLSNRWAVHRHALQRDKHHSVKLQRAWNKYGADAFVFEVIEQVPDKSLLVQREQHWLDQLVSHLNGYNHLAVAGSSLGRKFGAETIQKMSAQRKGRLHTPEAKAKMSASNKGRKKSPEHCANISAGQKGKVISEESRRLMSEAAKRRAARTPKGANGRFIPSGQYAEHDVRWSETAAHGYETLAKEFA
jgi:group I intron endonuclease